MPSVESALQDTQNNRSLNAQHSRVLDLSRSFSRADRSVATGIDRVERAYWSEFERREADAWAVVRLGKNYALLDQIAAGRLMRTITKGGPIVRGLGLSKKQLSARLAVKVSTLLLRFTSCYCGTLAGLMSQLAVQMPQGFDYFNVGHSNLDDAFLHGLRRAGAKQIVVKLHDTIPLDYPEFTRARTPAIFARRIRAALRHADTIICNSAYTARCVESHGLKLNTDIQTQVAHLGIEVPPVESLPTGVRSTAAPYFLCVGTIEPRKNHALLLEVWEKLVTENKTAPPHLVLVGARGWNCQAVFNFLDRSPLMGRYIHERGPVEDNEMFDLLAGASGLLFPSFVEGYGLPAMEAAALGTPVLCSDIDVFNELLDQQATFLPATDACAWVTAIQNQQNRRKTNAGQKNAPRRVPSWASHFKTVLGVEYPAR